MDWLFREMASLAQSTLARISPSSSNSMGQIEGYSRRGDRPPARQ